MIPQSTVLITGGTGFLGVHLARYFLKKKYKVILLDTAEQTAKDLFGKVTVINCDIRDYKKMEPYFSNVDYVVHAAAALPIHHNRTYIFDVNVNGTRNVLKASQKNKVKKVVFISTKAAAEKLCREFNKKGVHTNILRPKSFLGPERLGVFTIWFEAIFQNRPVFILGKGNNLYQLLEVVDLCSAIESALLVRKSGETYNVGAEKFGTWQEDLGALIKHAKSKSKIICLPVKTTQFALSILETFNLSPIIAWHYKTFPVDSYVSIEKAKKQLGYTATKSNQDILKEAYDWYKEHRKEFLGKEGKTHRTIWNFKIVDFAQKFFR